MTNKDVEFVCNVIEIKKCIDKLQQDNENLKKQLKEKEEVINYLRRSVERKEETIIDLQLDIIEEIKDKH